jgi:hypothetical protein
MSLDESSSDFFTKIYNCIKAWHTKEFDNLKDGVQEYFFSNLKTTIGSPVDLDKFFKTTCWDVILPKFPPHIQALFEQEDAGEKDKEKVFERQ